MSAPERSDYRFAHTVRVRWSEVDPQQIVFNAHYLSYADLAVTEYWRRLGLPYPGVLETYGGDLYMRHVEIDYTASARFDDMLALGLRCERLGNSSLTFDCAMFLGNTCINRVRLVYVYADPATQKSQPVPQGLRESLQAFEAGEPMFDVKVGHWGSFKQHGIALRRAVFIEEQSVPEELEWDEWDASSVHALAVHRSGRVVGTARLLPAQSGVSRLGRMAVDKAVRGAGIGRLIMERLVDHAHARGDRQIDLHAQIGAQAFYERLGFRAHGEVFDEAGIKHVAMSRTL